MFLNTQIPKASLPPSRPRRLDLSSRQAQDLVAFYPLDDRNPLGTKLSDLSPYRTNGGTINAPVYGKEDSRSFLRFPSGSSATAPEGAGNNVAGPAISYGGWFNLPADPSNFRLFFGKMTGPGSRQYSFFFAPNSLTSVYCALSGTGFGGNGQFLTLTTPWVVNTWQHIFFTYTSGQTDIYLNGALAFTSAAYTGNISSVSGSLFRAGTEGGLYPFNGRMSDLRVYNRKLTVNEVLDIYINGYSRLFEQDNIYPFLGNSSLIKSWNSVLYTDVKDWNGVPRSSIKSMDGVLS